MGFERAGDSYWEKKSKAAGLKATTNHLRDLNPEDAHEILRQAAEIFEGIGIINIAAQCFSDLGDHEKAGSCWAFSSTRAIEGINAIVTGDLISLSEQELVDCDKTNDGCEGGYMDYAFEWVMNNGGIDTETDYPYTGVDSSCNITKADILEQLILVFFHSALQAKR
ncbi:oryzain alpha chain-like [Arachis stenosperma]|uniref:oryzain alpha chain-like n=1 Tax=Arachis stenosperma TaxID=217475 RepID=UPI0025AD67AE|nr:oryzain alpha chain-like [Arachis stenosperma]